MAAYIATIEAMDDTLRDTIHETRECYFQDPTPENRAAYRQALQVFADWAMRQELKNDFRISRAAMTAA
jgi:hypothetical protein